MNPEFVGSKTRPTHYVCPCCHLYLLSWDPPTASVEMYHKVGLWTDSWTGKSRIVCQSCLGATDILPDRLVDLLYQRFGLGTPRRDAQRTSA